MNRKKMLIASALALGMSAVPASAFAQDAATQGQDQKQEQTNGKDQQAQSGEQKAGQDIPLKDVQGVVAGFGGVYSFKTDAKSNDPLKDFAEQFKSEKSVEAPLDSTGEGLNNRSVHVYFNWMNKEYQDRINGIKHYQTELEAARSELPTNPFNGQKATSKEEGLQDVDKMLEQAKKEYGALDKAYKEDAKTVPQGMKELYVKFVKEKADQARKNIALTAHEDSPGYANTQKGLDDMIAQKDFSIDKNEMKDAVAKATDSPEKRAELKVDNDTRAFVFAPEKVEQKVENKSTDKQNDSTASSDQKEKKNQKETDVTKDDKSENTQSKDDKSNESTDAKTTDDSQKDTLSTDK